MKILKLGGSAITDKKGYRKARPSAIKSLAEAVAKLWRKGVRDLVIVHGAGSFGHALVIKHGLQDGVKNTSEKLGFADTHAACSELSLMLVEALIDNGAPAISIPPAAIVTLKDKRISSFDTKLVNDYLDSGYLPVLYGDMAPDSVLGGYPCSGDQIVSYLGKGAEMIVLASDVDGVLDDKGQVIPSISRYNLEEVSKHLKHTENDVTGGMRGKIEELLGLGTTSYIVNAKKPERILSLFEGKEAPCTRIDG
ncbi:MAG: isopentenyl phosphate kinase [Candidatus Micrarchaeota archaeon]